MVGKHFIDTKRTTANFMKQRERKNSAAASAIRSNKTHVSNRKPFAVSFFNVIERFPLSPDPLLGCCSSHSAPSLTAPFWYAPQMFPDRNIVLATGSYQFFPDGIHVFCAINADARYPTCLVYLGLYLPAAAIAFRTIRLSVVLPSFRCPCTSIIL